MSKGNRYVIAVAGPALATTMHRKDFVQFGAVADGEFDPDLVDYIWGGEAGMAIYLDSVIKWPDGQVSETTYDPERPAKSIDIMWNGERTTWHLEGAPEPAIDYVPVEDIVVGSDPERRVVTATIRNLRLTMSPEKAEEIMRRFKYHVDRAKDPLGK